MKYKEIAKAWLDGAEVECREHTGEWALLKGPDEMTFCYFDDRYEYRIKPKTTVVTFKVYKRVETNEIRCVDIKSCYAYDLVDGWVCISDKQTAEVPLKI